MQQTWLAHVYCDASTFNGNPQIRSTCLQIFKNVHLQRQALEVLPCGLDTVVSLVAVGTLAQASSTLATSLAANDLGNGVGPLARIGTLTLQVSRDVATVDDLAISGSADDVNALVLLLGRDSLDRLLDGLRAGRHVDSGNVVGCVLVLSEVVVDSVENLLVLGLLHSLLLVKVGLDDLSDALTKFRLGDCGDLGLVELVL